jgi:thiamine-monophosphate kinase
MRRPSSETRVSSHTSLGPGGEFDRLRRALTRLGSGAVGIGDDCAFVEIGAERLALSCDLTLEGTHFQAGWLSPVEIGWRATAAALSDLAAVAAQPLGVLLSVAVPSDWPEEHFADLLSGAGEAARAVGAVIWGGDLVRGDHVAVDVTVAGRLAADPVRRSGAAVGDELWVTGALGGPFCAVAAWNAGQEPEETARERFAHPVPRIAEGLWLGEHGARAMIDVSDGLVADAGHLAAASGVGWAIDPDRVPVHPAAEVMEEALVSGEEYELLVALAAGTGAALAATLRAQFGVPLTRVGVAEREPGVRVLRAGKPLRLPSTFTHFAT